MNTIAAISTAKGVGGIGVIRISGKDAIEIANKVFKPINKNSSLMSMKGYTAKYGRIIKNDKFIDDAIALVFRSPNSYTGEDVVEISCHGGLYLTREVLRLVLDSGATLAQPGEFTKRAFLNGKLDLSQAESVIDLINAKSEHANMIAYHQKEGAISKKVDSLKERLLEISASLSVWADYPEDDIPDIDSNILSDSLKKINDEISSMIKNYDVCAALKEGVKTVIVGKPNVGKSTLMNLISGFDKSIVTDIAGTTRDIVEETVMIGDIPLLLVDTAGIRETDDKVEKIGVEKAKKSIKTADLILLILDSSKELNDEDKEILNFCDSKKTIIILNKIDLKPKLKASDFSTFSENIVEISALNAQGIEKLRTIIEKLVGLSNIDSSETVISNERQLSILKNANSILQGAILDISQGVTLDAVTVLIQEAIDSIMQLTGENVTEEVVNKIFSKFCVGK